VEVIDFQVAYTVVIAKPARAADQSEKADSDFRPAENLCLCEVSDDVELTLCPTEALFAACIAPYLDQPDAAASLAASMLEYASTIAASLDAAVMAVEFKIAASSAYMIDLNLQSNYNFAAEEALLAAEPAFVGAAPRYVRMLLRHGAAVVAPAVRAELEARCLESVPDAFHLGNCALHCVFTHNGEQITKTAAAKLLGACCASLKTKQMVFADFAVDTTYSASSIARAPLSATFEPVSGKFTSVDICDNMLALLIT
jgi:hypothetical protein